MKRRIISSLAALTIFATGCAITSPSKVPYQIPDMYQHRPAGEQMTMEQSTLHYRNKGNIPNFVEIAVESRTQEGGIRQIKVGYKYNPQGNLMKDRPLFRLEYVRDKNGNPIKYLEAHDFKTGGKEITNPVEKQRIKDYFSWENYCPDGRFDLEITLEDIEESRRRVKQFENKSNQELNPQFLNLPQIQKPQPKPRLKPRRELKNLPEFLRNILRS